MSASVTQIGGKMIAETSVLFVSVKKVFDTTTLETLHHWLRQCDPILVKSIEISSVQCFCSRCCHRSCRNKYWKNDHDNSNRNDCGSLGQKKEWQDCPGAKIVHKLVAVLLLPLVRIISSLRWNCLHLGEIISILSQNYPAVNTFSSSNCCKSSAFYLLTCKYLLPKVPGQFMKMASTLCSEIYEDL